MLNPTSYIQHPDKAAAATSRASLGIELTDEENATAVKAIANAKGMGPGGLPVDLRKLRLKQDQILLLELHRFTTLIWCEG